MSFFSWHGKGTGSGRRVKTQSDMRRRRSTFKPRLEALEDRFVPASGLSASLVADIVPGSDSSNPSGLTNVNGTLYFSTVDGLYKSDGTAAGTVLVKDDITGGGFTSL